MPKYQKPLLNYNADDVWAATCFAQRTNGTYIKNTEEWKDQAVDTNRQLIEKVMAGQYTVSDEDREQAKKVRKYYQALTFKILKGIKLSEFDNTAMLISNRDIINDNYDVAVIASLPSCYERGVKRDGVDQRVKFATGGYIGRVSDKVKVTVEILKTNYSQQWNTNYVTGITSDDQAVFFAYNHIDNVEIGKTYTFFGTVKAHRDNSTQLNRVKIVA